MRKVTLSCDNEGCPAQVEMHVHGSRPEGWLILSNCLDKSEDIEVCSLECAVEQLRRHRKKLHKISFQ
jgi:hypothetical protein